MITSLKPNQIFVFGSNEAGRHGAGAAKTALDKFGAKWGVGVGLTGRTYAIPTKDLKVETLCLSNIAEYVKSFILFAEENKDLEFLVTEIGCGLAGYEPEDIAPLFFEARKLKNVVLPERFVKVLESSDCR